MKHFSKSQQDALELIEDWQVTNDSNKILHLPDLDLTRFPSKIFYLTDLKGLDLAHNEIRSVPSDIVYLKNLSFLNLADNSLGEIKKNICKLTNLRILNLSLNDLKHLPEEIVNLTELEILDLRGNRMLEKLIPKEILDETDNPQKILNYYFKITQGKTRPLNEAKIVVIGEADFGKTLLIRRLIYNDFIETKSTTGIKIERWENVIVNNENVRLNVWDFGGQEIMHSTHQFFFTNRTIYILVIDARQNEDKNQTEEWLKRIESFGGNSPIIIVGTHIDQNQRDSSQKGQGYFDINRRELLEKFKNIKDFYGVCNDVREKGYDNLFEGFKSGLITEVSKLNDIHKPFPLKWFSVKEDLESMSKNKIPYISNHDYLSKCFAKDVKDEISKDTIREFLNEVGTVIYFKDLPERMVFNPEWITQGVYALVDNTAIIDNKGELEISYLTEVLNSKGYKKDEHKYILELMRKFKLCRDIEPNKKILIPDLLMKAVEPDDIGDWKNALNFQYHYETYLKNIFTQFVVRIYPLIYQKLWWRNGVILEREGSKALVKFYASDKKVVIKVTGNNIKKRQNLLAIIRKEFEEIHNKFQNLGITEWVAHPTRTFTDRDKKEREILRKYDRLLKMEEKRMIQEFVDEIEEDIPISEWLDGIESKEERMSNAKLSGDAKYNFPNAKQVTIIEKAEDSIDIVFEKHQVDVEILEEQLADISSRMNDNQIQIMEKIADDLMIRIENNLAVLNKEEKSEFEEAKKGKWETKFKTVIPIVPKVPGFDVLPSSMIEITRTIEPVEYISTIQKWLYGDNSILSILQTYEVEEGTNKLNKW